MREARAKRPLNPRVLGAILFAVFVTATVLIEIRDEIDFGGDDSCDVAKQDNTPRFYATLYRMALARSGEKSEQVAVVGIESEFSDIQQNVCKGRDYLANLINAVKDKHPKAIVLDKYFTPRACPSSEDPKRDDAATEHLKTAIREAGRPVFIGESTRTAAVEKDESCLIANDQKGFEAPNVQHGLLRLNANKEQIPISWRVRLDESSSRSRSRQSLSVKVANHFASDKQKNTFRDLQKSARQPYGRVFPQVAEETSTALLCNSDFPGAAKKQCSDTEPQVDLKNKIVVIGSQSDSDNPAVFGKERVYGYRLQALYIQDLLSSSYLKAVAGYVPVVILIVFLILLEAGTIALDGLSEREWHEESSKTAKLVWIIGFSLAVDGILCLWFVHNDILPPLTLIFAVLLACITRVVILFMEYSGELIAKGRK